MREHQTVMHPMWTLRELVLVHALVEDYNSLIICRLFVDYLSAANCYDLWNWKCSHRFNLGFSFLWTWLDRDRIDTSWGRIMILLLRDYQQKSHNIVVASVPFSVPGTNEGQIFPWRTNNEGQAIPVIDVTSHEIHLGQQRLFEM